MTQAPPRHGFRAATQLLAGRVLPRRADYPRERARWAGDLVAGVTVGVVALPLALGFGVASGVGPMPGLVTAIVAGVVAAVFGGSNLQVSGPTGAMTVVLVPLVAQHGPGVVPLLAVLAGCMVVASGLLGLGRAVHLIPWPVVEGFTLGIAAIIFLQQVPLVLRSDEAREAGHRIVPATIDAVRTTDWGASVATIALASGVVLVLELVRRVRPAWPASLVAVAAATACTWGMGIDVPVIGAISIDDVHVGVDVPPWARIDDLLGAALVVAFLAALESLLSARVADGMSDVDSTDPDRELVGQGLANVASGIFGGLPATGAIARTAVSVRSGARTRAAAIAHGIVLLVVLVVAGGLVRHVPLAALAGVLFVTAARMFDPTAGRAVMRSGRSDGAVFAVTALVTIAFDLVTAVEVGIGIAAVLALRTSARMSTVQVEPLEEHVDHLDDERVRELLHEHVVVYRFQGSLFFGAAQRFLEELVAVDRVRVVVLRLGALHVLDATGAHSLVEGIAELRARGIDVVLCGVRAPHAVPLAALGIPGALVPADRIHTRLEAALQQAGALAARTPA